MISAMFDAREVLIPGSAYDRSNGAPTGTAIFIDLHQTCVNNT